jgi:hypothetical protein
MLDAMARLAHSGCVVLLGV